MDRTLGDFLNTLDTAGELLRITSPVSPMLEISAIAGRHVCQSAPSPSRAAMRFDPDHAHLGGQALLFEDVEGCDFPVAINVFGSYRRMEMALGVADGRGFEAIADRLASLTRPEPPRGFGELVRKGRELLPLLRVPPKTVRSGACQEVVKRTADGEVDLMRLPIIKCWPLDGDPAAVGCQLTPAEAGTAGGHGRYITFAGMHTIHADDADDPRPASHNIGMYRAQLLDSTHLAMHWHMHHDGAAHWRSWKKAGKPMPIAICLGGESVLPYAATAPLPPGISELLMAGFLNGKGIPLVPAKTVPLRVPANSEIVIEGYVSTECGAIGWLPGGDDGPLGPGAVFEGPFGDHTGYYSLPDRYPIVDVTAITHRREAVYPTTIVGLPPQEDYYLGKATERIFLPLLKTLIPDIEDYHLPMFGCFHNCAFVRIRKAYPLQARRVMHAIWGAGQMAWTKMIVVVDDDVDIHREDAVLTRLFEECVFSRDIELVNGPLDILDHAAPRLGAGHKIGFDATRVIPGEEVNGVPWKARPATADGTAARAVVSALVGTEGIERVDVPECSGGRAVFVWIEKSDAQQARRTMERIWTALDEAGVAGGGELVVVVDADVPHDADRVWFTLCANADPGRDRVVCGKRIGFDATVKEPRLNDGEEPVRAYPPVVGMPRDVLERIDGRAAEFGLE